MTISNYVGAKFEITMGPIYRNYKLKEWIEESFETELERSAAWACFTKIKELHPEAIALIRGTEVK